MRREGDWEAWIEFFLRGVEETSEVAVRAARSLADLFGQDRARILALKGKTTSAALVYEAMKRRPLINLSEAAKRSGIAFVTADTAMKILIQLGIASEITGKERGRLFRYDRYIEILNEGLEPLRP